MPEALEIRQAKPDDAQAIAEIASRWSAADPSLWKGPDEIRKEISAFGPREAYLVLQREQVILGWALIQLYSDRLGYRFCAEVSLCVRRSRRRRGHGSRLEAALLNHCRQHGFHHLLLRTYADNETCIEFLQRRGYQVVGTQQQICYDDGWRDVVILQRILKTTV